MWPFVNPDDEFCSAIQAEFGSLAKDCGTSLQVVDTLIFGFRTPYAVLTIGSYPGHFRSVCVKLRPSDNDGPVSVMDGGDIGLANIELFVTGKMSSLYSERTAWERSQLRKEVKDLAAKVREVAMPFLTTPAADWDGVRDMIAERISRMSEDRPWLKKYEKQG